MIDAPRLEARQVVKRFLGVTAVNQVSLTIAPGEVVAVVGENGAGKSTLMKMLAGVHSPDGGQLLVDGRPVQFHNVDDALRAGITLIHQELNLSDNLDVTENLFLGREAHHWGWLNRKKMEAEAKVALERVGLDVPIDRLVADLPIGQQQLLEIGKALASDANVLIMDEPTSSLSLREAETLMQVIDQLRESGISVVYISHRLAEVERIADRVVVLRDGQYAGELQGGEIDHEAMVSLMVGRDVSQFYQRTAHEPGDLALEVKNLITRDWPQSSNSIAIRRGEIVGLAGLVGAGRSEFLRAVFGVDQPLEGEIRVCGQSITVGAIRSSIQAGLALVPENRKEEGLILEMTIRENASLASLFAHAPAGWIDQRYERDLCDQYQKSLRIRMTDSEQPVGLLSGGNQQKVVLAKWLALEPQVLLLDEPTRGIDIGAKEEIYHLIDEFASRGVAVLFASSEMEEIIGISDRVFVMREGLITAELSGDEITEQKVMDAATRTSAK